MCAPIPKGKWSWKFEKCVKCQTATIKHKGRGLCLHCWDKDRDKKPVRQKVKKQCHDRWYIKVKGTPEFTKYTNERAKLYRDTSPAYQLFLKKQYKRLKFRRIAYKQATGKGRRLKRDMGIQYRCPVCPSHIITSPLKGDLNHKLFELEMFKKEMLKVCLTPLTKHL